MYMKIFYIWYNKSGLEFALWWSSSPACPLPPPNHISKIMTILFIDDSQMQQVTDNSYPLHMADCKGSCLPSALWSVDNYFIISLSPLKRRQQAAGKYFYGWMSFTTHKETGPQGALTAYKKMSTTVKSRPSWYNGI